MTITKTIVIDVEANEATKDLEKFNETIEETDSSTEELTGSLDAMTGGAVAGFGKMLGGIKKTIAGFKSLKVAIAATGIGLLIVAIGSVATAFKASEEGQNKFAKLMGQIGVVTGNVIDIFANLGESILAAGKALVRLAKGDIKGASAAWSEMKDNINEVTEGIKNFGEETKKEFAIATEIADKRAEATRLQRELITDIAEAERDVAELRDNAARKDLFNAEQRKAFLEEAAAINDRIIDQQIEAARLTAEALAAENELSKSTIEDKEAQAQAEAELIRLETLRFTKRKELSGELSAINQQELAEKEALAAAERKLIEDETAAAEAEINAELEREQKKEDDLLAIQHEAAIKADALRQEQARKELELTQAVGDAKVQIEDNISSIISNIVGRDSKAAKGVAVAQATINTFKGVTSALSAPQVIPDPIGSILRFTNAAAVGVAGFANVKNILKTNPTTGGGGSASTGNTGGGRAPSFNLVRGTGTNQITEGLRKENAPVKSYVVSSDVSTSQELDRKIVEGASL